jgi:hypothetical protein
VRLANQALAQAVYADIARSTPSFSFRTSETVVYGDAAKNDGEWGTRRMAVEKLTDQTLLADVARNASGSSLGLAAVEKLTDQALLADIAKNCESMAWAAVKRLADQALLTDIATSDRVREDVGLVALERLDDQAVLARIATSDCQLKVRLAAVTKLDDQAILAKIATSDVGDVRALAARRLGSYPGPLVTEQLIALLEDPDPWVRREACSQLGERGDPQALRPLVAALERSLKTPDNILPSVVSEACSALRRLASEHRDLPGFEVAIIPLLSAGNIALDEIVMGTRERARAAVPILVTAAIGNGKARARHLAIVQPGEIFAAARARHLAIVQLGEIFAADPCAAEPPVIPLLRIMTARCPVPEGWSGVPSDWRWDWLYACERALTIILEASPQRIPVSELRTLARTPDIELCRDVMDDDGYYTRVEKHNFVQPWRCLAVAELARRLPSGLQQ